MEEGWLQDKCLVVIGGTTGLGLSACEAFIREGANVVAIGRNPESVEKASSRLTRALVKSGDATNEGTADQAIADCVNRFGGFHGLYHVAGGSGRRSGDGPLHEMTKAGWDFTLNLNLTSLMLSNQAAIRYFLKKKQAGSILNVGSVLGHS